MDDVSSSPRSAGATPPPAADEILIEGARENNLKSITVRLPHRRLTVLTGVSGSGKSSLAFDTLFAEGQRRYVESLSAYARQFLGQLERPHYDRIRGLSPTLAVSAAAGSGSPRSTVGTMTEVRDFLRVLYARLGIQYCHRCGREVGRHDPDRIRREMAALPEGTRFLILAPLVRDAPGDHRPRLAEVRRDGYARVRVDGVLAELTEQELRLDPCQPHTIEVVIDRLVVRPGNAARVTDSLETGLRVGRGHVVVSLQGGAGPGSGPEERRYADALVCPWCDLCFPPLTPASFSFNSPQGCCPACRGLGRVLRIDPARIVPDPRRSILDGAIQAPGFGRVGKEGINHEQLQALAARLGFDLTRPWQELPPAVRQIILEGEPTAAPPTDLTPTGEEPTDAATEATYTEWLARQQGLTPDAEEEPERGGASASKPRAARQAGGKKARAPSVQSRLAQGQLPPWEGIGPTLLRRLRETSSEWAQQAYQSYLADAPCPTCRGARLRPESTAVRLGSATGGAGRLSLPELEQRAATELRTFLLEQPWDPTEAPIAAEVVREAAARLRFLGELGLGYLTLDRPGPTLSGGELQRIRLAGHLGGELSGVTYVLDEPSVGLHPVDADRLIGALRGLRDAGNTVVVVEHDERVIRAADHVIDFGPGAGEAGGTIVASGTVAEVAAAPASLTGAYLAGRRTVGRRRPRPPATRWLTLTRARGHNLQGIDLALPLGRLVAITGVSGAGKSTLIGQTLYPALAARLHRATTQPEPFDELQGVEQLDHVVEIDQRPIGRSPRSTAATYTGAFELIRELFAGTPEARAFGFAARRFSFNTPGGRCEVCRGEGYRKVEMHFLPDVQVHCEACQGQRFNEATLRVRYRGLNIAQVLELPCEQAAEQFGAHPTLARIFGVLREVGLGYLKLGQPASTLSGGEAQRVKLARELARPEQGRSLYLLDEPSRGLHPEDLARLLLVLEQLVEHGNTVVVVEHNLDIARHADHLIDLGPGGGQQGGRIVVAGTPAEVAACPASITGRYLKMRNEE